jgi:hypothetical protein
VAGGEGALRVDHRCERLGDPVDPRVVGGHRSTGGRRCSEAHGQVGEQPIRVWKRKKRIRDGRVEPAAAANAHHLASGLDAVVGDEHVHGLRKAGDTGENRDRLAAQLVWRAGPSRGRRGRPYA